MASAARRERRAFPERPSGPAPSGFWRSERGLDWRAAILLGLISSSYSTLISQCLAARLGRDAAVDWMVVATIPFREGMLQVDPRWTVILAGILFHQWADFSWEVFFFGLLGRWTARLSPGTLVVLALPWAIFTSAMEWFVLVPLFPFFQAIFPLEQPYWIGLLVHLASASIYPLFPLLRDWVGKRRASPNRRFATIYAGLACSAGIAVGLLAFAGHQGHELPWMGRDVARDQAYMRRMSAHHAQGIIVAKIAVERATDPHLRALARLFVAEQTGEIAIFDQWWGSWFGGTPPVCSAAERQSMPGMLSAPQVDDLRRIGAPDFDGRFAQLMTVHHSGAVAMADEEVRNTEADPRLRVMSEAIRHGQQGEIEMMRRTHGAAAVRAATADMVSARIPLQPAPP
jgi:uncharacterized protein (DUF305 family)